MINLINQKQGDLIEEGDKKYRFNEYTRAFESFLPPYRSNQNVLTIHFILWSRNMKRCSI